MKSNILAYACMFAVTLCFGQVGVNTYLPVSTSALHIDGTGNNTSSAPSSAEQEDDVVITNTGQIGIGTATPNSSAIIELNSTSKGLYLPRVALTSSTDITTIPTPSIGLTVLQTVDNDLTSGQIYFWNGTKWERISDSEDFDTIVNVSNGETIGKIATNDILPAAGLTATEENVEFKICDCSAIANSLSTDANDLCYFIRLTNDPLGTAKANISISSGIGNGSATGNVIKSLTFSSANYSTFQIIHFNNSNNTNLGQIGYVSMNYPDPSLIEFYKISIFKNANANATGKKVFQYNKY